MLSFNRNFLLYNKLTVTSNCLKLSSSHLLTVACEVEQVISLEPYIKKHL